MKRVVAGHSHTSFVAAPQVRREKQLEKAAAAEAKHNYSFCGAAVF